MEILKGSPISLGDSLRSGLGKLVIGHLFL